MNVAVVDPDAVGQARTAALLRELGHVAQLARGERDLKDQHAKPDAVLLSVTLPPAESSAILRHLHALESPPYVIAVGPLAREDLFTLAYESGCDGELHLPDTLASLRARLRPIERRLAARNPKPAVEAAKPAPEAAKPAAILPAQAVATPLVKPGAALTPMDLTTRSASYKTIATELQKAMSTFLTMSVNIDLAGADLAEVAHARGIVLSNVDH
ncbi:MAG: response regulator transcription factor, partial [Deltaproteobacteria bacterium]|nr:response regulator transcription factor [Deltaproteobacteria bacterium]